MARKIIEYKDLCFEVSYEITPASSISNPPKSMLFLHGWGSHKDLMKIAFDKSFSSYEHIYIDLPGFGDSPNDIPLYTEDYAKIVELFLANIHRSIDVMVGHSFGGKVAVLCQPKELILLSSAGIPVAKSLKVRSKIYLAKILGKIGLKGVSSRFRSKDVELMNEGMYQTFKNVVDEDFSSKFAQYQGRASVFWGKADTATPLFCGYKIANLIEDSRFFMLEGDHYFFLKQAQEIETLYEGIQNE